jgi:hypothetical protein
MLFSITWLGGRALMSDHGILYVATKADRYIEEALLSADSVKRRCPNMHITVFTDRPEHSVCRLGCFDDIVHIQSFTGLGSNWMEAQMDRLKCLLLTPYERTLHIDSDTRILTDELPRIFDFLEAFDVGMVETSLDDSFCRYYYGQPMFNGGLVLYRRNHRTWAWLEEWVSSSEKNFRLAGQTPVPRVSELDHIEDGNLRRNLLTMDQISLCQILSPKNNRFDLKLKILSYSWNHRGSLLPDRNREAIRILHSPRRPEEVHAAELKAALSRLSNSNFDRSRDSRL